MFLPNTHASRQTNSSCLPITLPHLAGSLKDAELLAVGQRSIKRHHHHLWAAVREMLGNVSTGFGHCFNFFLTSQKHQDVLGRGCFLEPEENASEKLRWFGHGGRTEIVMRCCPDSRAAKHVRKKEKRRMLCKICNSLEFAVDSPEVKGKPHFGGLGLNRMAESFKVTCLSH